MSDDSDLKPRVMPKSTRTLWEQGHFIDFTIIVEGRKFPVHKVVIAAMSGHFCTLLTGSQKDSVEVEGLSACTMEKLIDFIYCKDINITQENVSEILSGAVQLQIQAAVQVCARFMIDNLDVENWCHVRNLFERYNLTDANYAVKSFIKRERSDIVHSSSSSQLSFSDMKELPWDICEWDLFLFINKWVDADIAERGKHRGDLLSKVRYCLLSPARLSSIIEMDIYKLFNSVWTQSVRKALKYHNLPMNLQVFDTSEQSKPRDPATLVLLAREPDQQFGFRFEHFKSYCFIGYEDLKFPALTGHVFGNIVFNDFLILCLKVNEEENLTEKPVQQWFIFNPKTVKWGVMADLPRDFARGSVIHDGASLYTVGGVSCLQDHITCTQSVETYSFQTDTWRSLPDLPSARMNLGACVLDGKLYVSGGDLDDGDEAQDSMECLTLSTMKWETKAAMLEPQHNHTLRVMKIKGTTVLCFLDEVYRLQCYNPETDQWSKCAFTYDRELPPRHELIECTLSSTNYIQFVYEDMQAVEEAIVHDEVVFYTVDFPEDGFSAEVIVMNHLSEAKIDIDASEFYQALLSMPVPDCQ